MDLNGFLIIALARVHFEFAKIPAAIHRNLINHNFRVIYALCYAALNHSICRNANVAASTHITIKPFNRINTARTLNYSKYKTTKARTHPNNYNMRATHAASQRVGPAAMRSNRTQRSAPEMFGNYICYKQQHRPTEMVMVVRLSVLGTGRCSGIWRI